MSAILKTCKAICNQRVICINLRVVQLKKKSVRVVKECNNYFLHWQPSTLHNSLLINGCKYIYSLRMDKFEETESYKNRLYNLIHNMI